MGGPEEAAYREGYLAALEDVERAARRMAPVGNWRRQTRPGSGRTLVMRQRAARLTELGSQHLAILRITQTLRARRRRRREEAT